MRVYLFDYITVNEQLSGIHWWYKTASHAAELTAGFYNPCNRDGYAPIASMLKKHGAALNFTCVELRTLDQHEDFPEALADPEGLVWQVVTTICFLRCIYSPVKHLSPSEFQHFFLHRHLAIFVLQQVKF